MTYDDLQKYVTDLAKQIQSRGADYGAVIAVGRGGMPVASMLAHELGIERCEYISYARVSGWLGDSFDAGKLPAKSLMVDDGAESGGTLKALAKRYGTFDSAVIVMRPDCAFPVTYHAVKANEPSAFVMPYEPKAETH